MTIDPIELALRGYASVIHFGPTGILWQASFVCMVLCLGWEGLMLRRQREREVRLALLSMQAVQRVERLLPWYHNAVESVLTNIDRRVGEHPALIAMAKNISKEVKLKAERDFCVLDSGRPESFGLLQMQLMAVLGTKQQSTTG